jgi:hypothetical protein
MDIEEVLNHFLEWSSTGEEINWTNLVAQVLCFTTALIMNGIRLETTTNDFPKDPANALYELWMR